MLFTSHNKIAVGSRTISVFQGPSKGAKLKKTEFNIYKVSWKKIEKKYQGLSRDLNPGPPAPKAGIIPLDH